jgi:hypothetical protein
MSINWKDISWWIVAVVSIAHLFGSAHHIISHF